MQRRSSGVEHGATAVCDDVAFAHGWAEAVPCLLRAALAAAGSPEEISAGRVAGPPPLRRNAAALSGPLPRSHDAEFHAAGLQRLGLPRMRSAAPCCEWRDHLGTSLPNDGGSLGLGLERL